MLGDDRDYMKTNHSISCKLVGNLVYLLECILFDYTKTKTTKEQQNITISFRLKIKVLTLKQV